MDALAVEATAIKKAYRTGRVTTPALRGIDIEVAPRECLLLVGPSGSGKTTLLSILGCVLTADSGQLRLLGCDVAGFSLRQRAAFRRRHIGFVFQRFHLFETLKAWENVRVVFDLLGVPPKVAKRESMKLLEVLGLADRCHHRVNELSMGQRQRVALARALAADPGLILADEPTASLDSQTGQNVMRILKGLCTELGKTVIIVTHDPRIFGLADRILTLADGRIVSEQQPAAAAPITFEAAPSEYVRTPAEAVSASGTPTGSVP